MRTQMRTGHTRLHLTRRGRVVFTTLAAIPLAAVALALALNGGIAAAEGANNVATNSGAVTVADVATVFDYVTIQSGQSLWQLAETIAPTSDPRDVIAEIVSLNQLPSENVQPGQRLALPVRF
ncbi:LysM peptidoglycan-binding domain-containing protein [Cryobacterium algoritolerans]|uniref:LysM peptidoglycan-binding domain-containing protein n=2 Tax=Cryobacterium algoritolerans TaxID=1259184 RepID=A0A4R8WW28_9MICO|nr:LysM peptidoglycan-binding domain-containing protein [Cryobacterium algoritolerans]TFC16224.1 LysM peptidoglycan-binding domain-containing protein [Cryobacterium algoritolerans]